MVITTDEVIKTFARLNKRIKPNENGCHNWTGGTTGENGYGRTHFRDEAWLTHRLIVTLIHGPIPKGMEVHHKCFNRKCMNPTHLELLTHLENSRIRSKKTKSSSGERCIYLVAGEPTRYRVILREFGSGKWIYGGIHDTLDKAIAVRDKLDKNRQKL